VNHGRPLRLAVWKLASCDGCQLALLDCEDELLTLASRVEIAPFAEATSRSDDGPWDLSLVEGSVSTPADAERVRRIRAGSRVLVTIGACATAGGIQALRNFAEVDAFRRAVYASPQTIEALARSSPVSDHVMVDYELHGCPVDRGQLLRVIADVLAGVRPQLSGASVCEECKRAGNVCVLVAHGTPCLGPVTRGGCGALCPSCARGCYGCFGPADTTNAPALSARLETLGMSRPALLRFYRSFNAAAPPFADESTRHE